MFRFNRGRLNQRLKHGEKNYLTPAGWKMYKKEKWRRRGIGEKNKIAKHFISIFSPLLLFLVCKTLRTLRLCGELNYYIFYLCLFAPICG